MAHSAPGRHTREGISLIELMEIFPNETAAKEWFEARRWPHGPVCPHCSSATVSPIASGKPMPWRCRSCRKHFSVRTDTVMEESKIPLRKWAIAIYLWSVNLKGVSSMKLHRDLKITQKSAWFLGHRLREAFSNPGRLFDGPVEIDETFMGGKRKNMPKSKRAKMIGRGAKGKTAVAGARDRKTGKVSASVVADVEGGTLRRFVTDRVSNGATVYTDEARAYGALRFRFDHEAVNHSVAEYVRGQAHTNGIESFWAALKRGYQGTFHHFSAKHMNRYVGEFAGRHNDRPLDTINMMGAMVQGMVGRRLTHAELISGGPAYV